MEVIQTKAELQGRIKTLKKSGNKIGFVPTMGALHPGHISLIHCCNRENDITVVSIFVNPTQFNERNDFEKYPRNIEQDITKLKNQQCDIIFTPSEDEMYPTPDKRTFDFGNLDKILEGYHRPGHFNGVAQIVSKLFDFVKPHTAYFGEKDFQQLIIIRELVKKEGHDIQVIGCPIIREEDGLAMSSRNSRLNNEERKTAAQISEILFNSKSKQGEMSIEEIKKWVTKTLNKNPHINVEYFEIVNEKNLIPVQSWSESDSIRGLIAAWVGDIRLIDNIKYD